MVMYTENFCRVKNKPPGKPFARHAAVGRASWSVVRRATDLEVRPTSGPAAWQARPRINSRASDGGSGRRIAGGERLFRGFLHDVDPLLRLVFGEQDRH